MNYKPEQFFLNKLCQFRNRDTELDFMDYDKTASLNIVRFMILVMGVVFAVFIFADIYFYRHKDVFPITVGLRALGLSITVAAFFLAGKFKRYEYALVMITLTQLGMFTIYLVNLYILEGTQTDLQFMTIMLFIMAAFLIPNVWKNSLAIACITLTAYIIFCAHNTYPAGTTSLVMRGIYLGICLVCCAVFLYGRETSRRKQFAAEKLLEYLSITDKLTAAYNRSHFEQVLGTWIKNRRHEPIALLLFDIDDFKKVNDRFGHMTGDQVLVGIAEIVSAHIRDNDVFARWGGEEFVVLFGNSGIEKVVELAERLRRVVEITPWPDAGKITISIGAAEYQENESIVDFVNRADKKMYEAKRAGKNQVMA
ncbi:MAG: diguanylate cyclase [Treponema sp.]|nr:diguanylate cyclase [Treponema sp.]